MAGVLTLVDFAPHLHTQFQVAGANGETLELISATDCSNSRLEQFSLVFVGRANPWLPQQMYSLTHPQMGELELFLVPIGPDASGMRYEAAFSRFIEM